MSKKTKRINNKIYNNNNNKCKINQLKKQMNY